MKIKTKLFKEIEVDESKLINFPQGIIGFPELTDFLLVHDSESEGGIRWMQSIQEPAFAMPVIDPLIVMPDYNPSIEDDLLKPLGDINDDNTLVLVTITVPHEIENMTVNLKAPIIINSANRQGCQILLESEEYKIKYPIYETLKKLKEESAAAAE